MSQFITQFTVIIALIISSSVSYAQSLKAARGQGATRVHDAKDLVKRSRKMNVDVSAFKIDKQQKRLSLDVFEDLSLNIDLSMASHRASDRATWKGKGDKNADEVLVSRYRNAVVIDIFRGATHIQIRPDQSGAYIAEETDNTKFPSLENDTLHAEGDTTSSATSSTTATTAGDASSVVDVLVLFAADSAASVGGYDAAVAFADNAAAVFNTGSDNSLIGTHLRVVGVVLAAASSSGSISTDLDRLVASSDGYFDEYAKARDYYGADLVHLISNSGDLCGQAYYTSASMPFGVSSRGCAIGNKTLAHEIGHNFGCAHNKASAGGSTTTYAYGHYVSGVFRTIMSYNVSGEPRVAHFSNPNVIYNGYPTGVANEADNARRVREISSTIANWRASVTPVSGSYLSSSVSNLNFGSVNIGSSKTLNIDFANTGNATIAINQLDVLAGAEFQSADLSNCLVTLSPFSSCRISVTFASNAGGSFNGTVVAQVSGANNTSTSVYLAATAVAPTPNISVSSSLAFAKTAVGSSSTALLRVSNNGTAALSISNASLANNGGGVFSVVSNNCVGAQLAVGASCDISLKFAPTVTGSFTGSFAISSNDLDQAQVNVTLSGSTGTVKGGGKGGGGRRK